MLSRAQQLLAMATSLHLGLASDGGGRGGYPDKAPSAAQSAATSAAAAEAAAAAPVAAAAASAAAPPPGTDAVARSLAAIHKLPSTGSAAVGCDLASSQKFPSTSSTAGSIGVDTPRALASGQFTSNPGAGAAKQQPGFYRRFANPCAAAGSVGYGIRGSS